MNRLIKITVFLSLLAVAAVGCNSAEEEAQETFENFINALDGGTISEITAYVTDDFMEEEFGVTKEDFENDAELIDEQMGELLAMFNYEILSFEVSEETDEQLIAAYEITIEEEETGETETEGGVVTLENHDNNWLISQMDE
ncbi:MULTISPECIES: hypothetical protein [Alteribacter]|uniref:DUF4878 domain-containing protein n=1 Tax=Alteribacter keqinensis TaxID=2483800 RepID=A0A3M7TSJ9_9BACI|nr:MULTISPECIES: hypothetical protein [Alteribacter]MBM7097529.1 hypothetical protein [Alteribacter salitolerans]RNA68487.1 hypothetical protein EBO34_00490 [Alteribacter keqinensis]